MSRGRRASVDFAGLRSIGVLRALQLGDMLCVVPALRALRRAAPRARITLIGLPWARAFANRYSCYIDDFLEFPGFPGMPEREPDHAAVPAFLSSARERQFDLLLQMHGSGVLTNPFCASLGAVQLAGFRPVISDRDSNFNLDLTSDAEADATSHSAVPVRLLPWNDAEHEVLRYLRLLRHLGISTYDATLEFPIFDDDRFALHAAGCNFAPLTYACVHPGARLASRRWPPARFALVADALVRHGLTVVLTGSESERPLVAAVRQQMREKAVDASGRTSLGALGMLVAQARLVVCNDTGISHLAAAVACPSVVICCGSDPQRWAPLDRQLHHALYVEIACRPCAHDICPIGHGCALDVPSTQVVEAVSRLLEERMMQKRTQNLTFMSSANKRKQSTQSRASPT